MSPVGHSLTGLAVGIVFVPKLGWSPRRLAGPASFVVAANIPDLPLPGWGHGDYRVSHSAVLSLAIISIAVMVSALSRNFREKTGGWRTTCGLSIAWLSHFLLDSLYAHGRGIALFWPLSKARLALPVPWFSTLKGIPPPLDMHTLRVMAIEFVFFFPPVLLAWWFRHAVEKRRP